MESFFDESRRHFFVKKVAHTIHENRAWLPPFAWLIEPVWMRLHGREFTVTPKAIRYPLGVAMFAARRQFCAARDRVPRHISPLD